MNNAAADTARAPVADVALEDWQRHFAVNVTAAFLAAKHAIPHMRAAGGGVVLNIASQLGSVDLEARRRVQREQGRGDLADALDRGGSRRRRHPRRQPVARGDHDQPADDALRRRGGDSKALAGLHPIGRLGTPEEVAEAALFLVSGKASFFTGSDVVMDGGYTAI